MGLIPTTLCLIAVGILSSFVCKHSASTVSQVPGNKNFDLCIEFAAIVDTAEVVDSILGLHYHSYAFSAGEMGFQEWSHPACLHKEVKLGLCDPFSDEELYRQWLLTAGYVITAAVFCPFVSWT